MTVKRFVRSITPPVLVTGWHGLVRRMRPVPSTLPEWEHVPEGWAAAPSGARVTGWDVAEVRDAYREKLRVFRDGLDANGPLAAATTPSVMTNAPSIHDQNLVLAYAYALALAARNQRAVSVLDWGGGVGLFYFLGTALLPSDVELEYHCKELPLVCDLGRAEVPAVQFHDDDSCLDRTYDLVIASSSLQYSEPWGALLDGLASATSRYLYLARVPVVPESPSYVVRQRAYEYGLGTEYLSWVLNRRELLDRAERAGLALTREFLQGYKPFVHGAPEQDETRGFLFQPRAPMTSAAVTCFTMADADNFIGLVAMVASLRVHGHDFPVVVLDLGFTPAQKAALEAEPACTVIRLPNVIGRHPFLLAPFPFLVDPEGVVVYLDADVIVTQPLGPLLDAAVDGNVCVVTDFLTERWFAEWAEIFGLEAPLRRQAYVNAGFIAFTTAHFPDLLRRWWKCCDALAPTLHTLPPRSDPVALPDQDALNALLMSEIPQDRQRVLPQHTEPMTPRQVSQTLLVDADRLACTFDGQPTMFLHPVGGPKPWQPQHRQRLHRSGYERCLRRLVMVSAPTVRAAETDLPAWLRPGRLGELTLRWLALLTWVRNKKFRVKRALSPLRRRGR